MRYRIRLTGVEGHYLCDEGQNLLEGMETRGAAGIPVGCRRGGCGLCKVRVTAGEFRTARMSRSHVNAEEESEGYVLACRCHPASDLTIEVGAPHSSAT